MTNSVCVENGIRWEKLTTTHDLPQIRKLLAHGFSFGNDMTDGAFNFHYRNCSLPISEKLRIMEEKSNTMFSEQLLARKIKEGLSMVAVNKPNEYVGVMFCETYNNAGKHVYSFEGDSFCEDIANFSQYLLDKAAPFMAKFTEGKIAFISHAVVCPKYRCTGILKAGNKLMFSQLAKEDFEVAYLLSPNDYVVQSLQKRHDFQVIAEVKFKDYQDINGRKVFAYLPGETATYKALVKYL